MVVKKTVKSTNTHTQKAEPSVEVYDAMESVKKGAKKTDSYVRKHPWKSVGIAAVAGAFIGRILFGRRRR